MKKLVLIIAFLVLFAGCTWQNTPQTYYEVTFDSHGGTSIPTQSVAEGNTALKPIDPELNYFTFVGWFYNDEPFDFTTEILSDITLEAQWEYEDYGMSVYEVYLSEVSISRDGYYTSVEEVGAYLYTFQKLPDNYRTKSEFNKNNYTPENKLSTGGDVFFNKEGLLPASSGRTYTECDIDYTGGSRNAKRIVFSSDWLIFYTDDHYASYSILRFYD